MKTKKRVIISTCIIALLVTFTGFSQEPNTDYSMASIVYMDVKVGHEAHFERSAIEHNEKYHNEVPNKGSLDQIISGSQAGTYAWILGPCTFTDLSGLNLGEEHDKHWETEVVPHIKSYGAQEYWKFNKDLSYFPTPDAERKVSNIWIIDLKRGDYYRFKALMTKIVEAHEKKGTGNMRVYDNQFNDNDGRDIAIVWDMKSMAELDIDDPLKPTYEEINGEGSWNTLLDEWEEITLSINSQLWRVDITKEE